MKKLSFLALAAVGLLLGACSSDRDVADVKSNGISNDGDQFVTLAINLPTTPVASTRNEDVTDDNNYEDGTFTLDDGLQAEYAVKDAMLIMFRPAGNSEDDATFVGAYDISPEPWTTSSDKQVTRFSAKIVQKVGSTVQVNDLALVILNRNELMTLTDGSLTVGNNTVSPSTTYKDFREFILTTSTLGAKEMTANGFYMANAPLTDKQGSTSTSIEGAGFQTLVPVENVYQTQAEAEAGDAAEIYVERGMAKVTLQELDENLKLGSNNNYGITFIWWTLDQTNTKSYAVRSTEGHSDFVKLNNPVVNKYRYAGTSNITEGNPTTYKYRTYFAKDPNYDKVATGELTLAVDADYTEKVGEANPQYCFENTFDVDNQLVENTTLARFKVRVGTGTDLYIVNEKKGTIYTSEQIQVLAANAAIEYIQAQDKLGNIAVQPNNPVEVGDFTVNVGNDAGPAAVTITKDFNVGTNGKIDIKQIQEADFDAALQDAVNTALKTVTCYKGGESYYTVRIKHFGEQLTPWHTGNAAETPQPQVGDIYPASDNRDNFYLGRYGVLRNNWYDIRINSIQYLGEATPKDYSTDPTTDDELDGYINVQINILSWAKRIQNWDL